MITIVNLLNKIREETKYIGTSDLLLRITAGFGNQEYLSDMAYSLLLYIFDFFKFAFNIVYI